jgi:serine/threonine protein kinase
LADRLSSKRTIAEDELITLFLDLTKAFSFLHRKGIVHHDIKPSNILFTGEGVIKISDFGCTNTSIGTKVYYAPELYLSTNYISDPRTDIFSLGVTLMECALGYNPFDNKTIDEKELMLRQANLPIQNLPFWLQDTIFKAVSIDLNARFQTMDEFHDAFVHKNVPKFLTSQLISMEKDANRLEMLVKTRKWIKAGNFISTYPKIEQNLNMLIHAGKYYLRTHQIEKAKATFERALHINPHAHIEKQLAEVYLQKGEISKATTILANYINQNFNDIEAHNQLLHAYFLSSRWELGQEQAELALKLFSGDEMIQDNLALFEILNDCYYEYCDSSLSPFHKYNSNVYQNNDPVVWSRSEKPYLHTKLLFHEYKFHDMGNSNNSFELSIDGKSIIVEDQIVAFGRKGYAPYAFSEFSGNAVSRLHFVIINQKNNVWLYDLESFTGIFVDEKRIHKKCFLLGLHAITFGDHKISLKTDTNLLI